MHVLFEDNHLLVVNKPSGLPTMGVAADRPSLLAQAKQYLKVKYRKPGNVYLGIVSRLDAPVTGVVVMCRTSKAAQRLTCQFRERRVDKIYGGVVTGHVVAKEGRWEHFVRKDERHRRMHVTEETVAGAQRAVLAYRVLDQAAGLTLLEVVLETGRKHQIRVQCAAAGTPIVGDRKYGSHRSFPAGIALHARKLRIEHPVKHSPLEFVAPWPASWQSLPFRVLKPSKRGWRDL